MYVAHITGARTMTFFQNARVKYVPPTETQLADAYALVDRFAAMWAEPNLADMQSLMHSDTRNLIPPMTEPADREGVLAHFGEVLRQLPDLWIEVVRWAPTGDTVMVEWCAHATVAGQPLSWTGVDRFGIRGGQMYEAHVYWDTRQVAAKFAAAVQAAQAA
jgi:ketosteroid isomerase-like protein